MTLHCFLTLSSIGFYFVCQSFLLGCMYNLFYCCCCSTAHQSVLCTTAFQPAHISIHRGLDVVFTVTGLASTKTPDDLNTSHPPHVRSSSFHSCSPSTRAFLVKLSVRVMPAAQRRVRRGSIHLCTNHYGTTLRLCQAKATPGIAALLPQPAVRRAPLQSRLTSVPMLTQSIF